MNDPTKPPSTASIPSTAGADTAAPVPVAGSPMPSPSQLPPPPAAAPQGSLYGAPPPPAPPQGPYRHPQQPPVPPSAGVRRVPLRNYVLAGLAGVAVLATALALLFRTPPPARARSIGARLDLAAGDVGIEGSSVDPKALSGSPLATGSTVKTAKGARALVRTGEGAGIFLRGETSLKLLEHGVSLESGEIWLDAPRVDGEALEIDVGKSSLTASDAGISIHREGDVVTAYVARGLAILSSKGGRVEVSAGEQGRVQGDGKPEVSPVAFWQDWTGGMGDQRGSRIAGSGTGRLYGLDPNAPKGAPARKLGIAKQVVRAVLRDDVAETEVDQTFANPGAQPIEGWYWFTVPTSAIVTGFALETNGQLVEGEVIERREAAARYEAAMRQAVDPALLEWVDGRTYRARIFPIPASGSRRVVLRYIEMLPRVEGKTRYVYPLRSDDPVRFDEFALSVDVGGGKQDVDLATSLDARVEPGGRVVSMRRSGYLPVADFQLEIAAKKKRPPVSAWRFSAGPDQADYVMLRYVPDKDFSKEPPADADVVFVVDTSAGGDESSRQLRIAAAEAAMRALSDRDHFALVALDVAPTVVYPESGLASATEGDIAKALEKLSDHAVGGATDLGAMFEPALARLHGKEQGALVYVGDGAATSGETSGAAVTDRLRRSLSGSRARFFALGVGADANHELLAGLARAGGGQYARIDEAGQTTGHALRLTSAIKTATISDLAVDLGAGLDQPLYSATGKLSRGEELVLLARTHHALPEKISVHGRIGGKDFDDKFDLKVDTTSVTASLVPRLWAAEYVRRLIGGGEESRGQVLQLGVEYGLITPYTSSLALESESAYAQQGIVRKRSRVRGVKLSAITAPEDEPEMMRAMGVALAPPSTMGCDKHELSRASEESPAAVAPQPMAPPGAAAATATPEAEGYDTKASDVDALGGRAGNGAPLAARPSPTAMASAAQAPTEAPAEIGRLAAGAGGGAAPRSAPKMEAGPSKSLKKTGDAPAPLALRADVRASAPPFARALAMCSDVASRPLAERRVVWEKRARKAETAEAIATLYDAAYRACELPDWRDEAALLDVVQQRIDNEHAVEVVLAHFRTYPDASRFLAKTLLRRTVDVRVAAAVSRAMYGGVDWSRVDRELLDLDKPDKQLLRVKQAMLTAPEDPQGDVRLVKLLARTGARQEALAHGRRLRDRGFLTPALAQELGDVLVLAGEKDEALRTYSEIVEFDGQSPQARRVLGDVFLRQGWYPAAYRQYKTLTDLDGKDPLAWLRLANAAAGAGRIDEALRIDREIAGGVGTPGPSDPRMFARLLSASRLGALLDEPDPASGITVEAVSRKLKELSLFSGPGTLVLLTWEDLDARLVLGASDPRKERLALEAMDAGAVGLFGLLGAPEAWQKDQQAVRAVGEILGREVPWRLTTIGWDGKAFKVTRSSGALAASARQASL